MGKTWKRRSLEIEMLKRKLGRHMWRPPLPNLKVEQVTAPLSNTIPSGALTPARSLAAGSKRFASGTTHKQGPIMLTPGMIANEMQFIGGKKV